MSFFESVGMTLKQFFETYGVTIFVFVVACISIGCLVEVFKIAIFTKMEEKYKNNPDKLAKIKTLKAGCSFALAAVLCAFFLACIYKDPNLPNIGGIACTPIWFAALFILQMLCDLKGLKSVLNKLFGKITDAMSKKEEEKKKAKKPKMRKEVRWVPVEEDDEE